MLTYGVVIFHDNVRPYSAARTRTLLENFNRELFDRSPSELLPPVNLSHELVAISPSTILG
jgi:hypothetical protein